MVGFFKKQMQVKSDADSRRILLVEKTDRLYRNIKDWVTLDELDIEIHIVKENDILSRDSRSSQKFMHGIRVLMAKNYIRQSGGGNEERHARESGTGSVSFRCTSGVS